MNTNHQKGFLRKKGIIEAIENLKVLSAEQVEKLFFPNLKSSYRSSRRVLNKLTETKRIKRERYSLNTPYIYYINKPRQIFHTLNVNWVYVWIKKKLRGWEELVLFEQEKDFGILRADSFVGIKNTVTKEYKFLFIEFDVAESGNTFDKVEKYERLFKDQAGLLSHWWVPLTDSFPEVIIVTTNDKRKALIEEKISTGSKNVKFKVYHIEQIKGEC